jgi:TRAP-type uncharacterized transport system fused permease subunit
MTTGQFWIVLWGISLWFILQRILTLFAFCKYYKVKPMAKEDLPSFRESLKTGWQGLLLPVIILLPFVLDYLFKDTFFTTRLGATGAKYMSSSLLLFIPGIAAIFSCLITKDKKIVTLFNKQDLRTDDEPMQDFRADKVLAISAAKNDGLEEVKSVLEEMLREDKIYIERVISYNNAGIIQLIRKQGELISEEYVAEGIAIRAYVPMEVYGKLD